MSLNWWDILRFLSVWLSTSPKFGGTMWGNPQKDGIFGQLYWIL